MKKVSYPLLFIMAAGLSSFVLFVNWKVNADAATVSFVAGNIKGTFKGLKADIMFDKEHPEQAKITATIETPSIATGFFLKNNHAKDALGADKYPTIKFVSSAVSKNGNAFIAKGNLTMKGVTKPAIVNFTFNDKGNQGVFKGVLKVIPKDYGINRNGTPDNAVVTLTVPVSK